MRNSAVKAHKWAPAEWPIRNILSCKEQQEEGVHVRSLIINVQTWLQHCPKVVYTFCKQFCTLSKLNLGPLSRAQTKQSAISWTIPKTFPWRSEDTSTVNLDAKVGFRSPCLLGGYIPVTPAGYSDAAGRFLPVDRCSNQGRRPLRSAPQTSAWPADSKWIFPQSPTRLRR